METLCELYKCHRLKYLSFNSDFLPQLVKTALWLSPQILQILLKQSLWQQVWWMAFLTPTDKRFTSVEIWLSISFHCDRVNLSITLFQTCILMKWNTITSFYVRKLFSNSRTLLFHSDNIKTLRHCCSIHSSLTGRGPEKTELRGHPPDPSWWLQTCSVCLLQFYSKQGWPRRTHTNSGNLQALPIRCYLFKEAAWPSG